MIADTKMENRNTQRELGLIDYFHKEQKGGNFLEYDFNQVDYSDQSDKQLNRIWALIMNNKKEDLIKHLFTIGLKLTK